MVWVWPMSSYNSCCFGPDGIKYESFCQWWEEVSLLALKPKITSELSCIKSTIENALVDYVAAVYALEEKKYMVEKWSKTLRLFLCIISPTYWSIIWVINCLQAEKSKHHLGSSKKCPLYQPMAMKRGSLILERNTLATIVLLLGQWSK